MADEISIRASLQINKDNLQERSYPTDFTTDMTGTKGPTPGYVLATPAGTDINLTALGTPGWCRVANNDQTNFVTLGMRDGNKFIPFQDVMPGEHQVIQLSRFLGDAFDTGTGTATVDTDIQLCIKSNVADCDTVVEVYDK